MSSKVADKRHEAPLSDEAEKVEIFCRYIRKNGKIIYPKKGKYFHFYARRKR